MKAKRDIIGGIPGKFRVVAFMLLLSAGLTFFSVKSYSQCAPFPECPCVNAQRDLTMAYIVEQHEITRLFFTLQMIFHQNWLFCSNERFFNGSRDCFFELHILPAMMMMAEQLVTIGMEQMLITGAFFDAKTQLETQQLFQKKEAEAHRDYHPSYELCTIGTNVRSMAASDRNGEYTSFVLSQRAQDRELGVYANGSPDSSIDREGRVRQVATRYCDPFDNSADLEAICGGGAPPETVNRDIDYHTQIDRPGGLNIDFTDDVPSHDELDTLALLSNLFSHDVLDKPKRTPSEKETGEGAYLEMRGLLAKRSVAQNSINAIIGMKAEGTPIAAETMMFTRNVLMQLGIDPDGPFARDWAAMHIGGTIDTRIDPNYRSGSYYAFLEILAQRIYQDAEFYTNLYDKPANVVRKDVAMQAINLMLERDMHKSELRSEMVLSVWLELELMKYQNDIQNRINSIEEKYEEN